MTEASVTEIGQYRDRLIMAEPAGLAPAWELPAGLRTSPPTGAVTFLLTDIEGSTERWESHREAMTGAVARHYEILDAAVTGRGGVRPIEQGEGDSMVAVFARPSDAVAATLDAQRALAAEAWPEGADLRVRMGLHTGEAQLREGRYYVGSSIIRCARVRALAYGGQVLVSGATAELVADWLPADASLRPLGTHRLKGLRRPETVFQLDHPELPGEFPPLRSLDTLPGNLPPQVTSFVGREAELAELLELLDRHRLVTLVGPGGCGKTRLAGQAAAELVQAFADGAWWVDLAPVTDPGAVGAAVLAALSVETKCQDPADRLAEYLAERRVLLVLDNCEHLLDAAGRLLERVLQACPRVVAMATSREPLGLRGENVWRVDPLSLPSRAPGTTVAAIRAAEAVQLFVERAVAARQDFRLDERAAPVVAEICAELDGIPLAIELAAARVRSLSPERLLASLSDRFRVLTGGARTAQPRQQTLAASVEWSHDLLAEPERVLFRRLAVFAGSFDLEAAEGVLPGGPLADWEVLTVLADLVDKSLVVFDGERYRLLQTIRDFAGARLADAGEAASTRAAHLAYYRGVAASAAAELEDGAQLATLERLEGARDNLLAAVEFALESGADEAALQIGGDLALFWHLHGRHAESLAWLRRVLDGTPDRPTPMRARALWAAGQLGLFGMDLTGGFGIPELERAVAMAGETGADGVRARALGMQGLIQVWFAPDSAEATLATAHEVAVRAGDRYGATAATTYRAMLQVFGLDRPDRAEEHLSALEAEAAATGSPFWGSWLGLLKGIGAWRCGRLDEAARLLAAADELAWEVGEPVLESWCARWLADVHTEQGDFAAADRVVARSAAWMDRSSFGRIEIILSRGVQPALQRGDVAEARRRLTGLEAAMACAPFLQTEAGLLGARIALAEGDLAAAHAATEAAAAAAKATQTPWYLAHAANAAGRLARAQGDPGGAEEAHLRALALCVTHSFAGLAAETLDCLASLATAGESWAEAARLYAAAGALRERTGYVRPPLEVPSCAADLAQLATALGEEAMAVASVEGAALGLAEVAAYASRARGERKRPSSGWDSLTPTERQVVALAADGLSNVDIAKRLFVSPGTVKVHLHHIFGKLGVTRRAELASRATERRLTLPPEPGEA